MSDQHEELNMGSTVWQSQPVEVPRISLEFVHHQSEKVRRSLKNERDMFYIVAAGAVMLGLVSIYKQWNAHDWNAMSIIFDLSMLLYGLGLICAVFHLRRKLRARQMERSSDVALGLAVYRSELERLIQLTRQGWRALMYFAPGYLIVLAGGLVFDQRPGRLWRYGLTVVAGVVSVCFALWAGRKKSRCLQRELDAIASLK